MVKLDNLINKIIHGDCLEVMKEVPEKSVDMILCDLPYGVTARNEWDKQIEINKLFNIYNKIIKVNGVIVLTAIEPFASKLIIENLNFYKYSWYWKKERGTGFLNAKKQPLRIMEEILVFYNKQCKYNPIMVKLDKPYKHVLPKYETSNYNKVKTFGKEKRTVKNYTHSYPKNIIEVSRDNNRKNLHPTQKPILLFEYLIKTYTNEGDLVLDNCIGSGTTGVACINTNRKFIGIELDDKYAKIASERCNVELIEYVLDKEEVIKESKVVKEENKVDWKKVFNT